MGAGPRRLFDPGPWVGARGDSPVDIYPSPRPTLILAHVSGSCNLPRRAILQTPRCPQILQLAVPLFEDHRRKPCGLGPRCHLTQCTMQALRIVVICIQRVLSPPLLRRARGRGSTHSRLRLPCRTVESRVRRARPCGPRQRVTFGRRFTQLLVHDRPAVPVEQAGRVVEHGFEVDVPDVDVKVLVGRKRLDEKRPLLRGREQPPAEPPRRLVPVVNARKSRPQPIRRRAS